MESSEPRSPAYLAMVAQLKQVATDDDRVVQYSAGDVLFSNASGEAYRMRTGQIELSVYPPDSRRYSPTNLETHAKALLRVAAAARILGQMEP